MANPIAVELVGRRDVRHIAHHQSVSPGRAALFHAWSLFYVSSSILYAYLASRGDDNHDRPLGLALWREERFVVVTKLFVGVFGRDGLGDLVRFIDNAETIEALLSAKPESRLFSLMTMA